MPKAGKSNSIYQYSLRASQFIRVLKAYQQMCILLDKFVFWLYLWMQMFIHFNDSILQLFFVWDSLSSCLNNIGEKTQSVCMLFKFQKCFILVYMKNFWMVSRHQVFQLDKKLAIPSSFCLLKKSIIERLCRYFYTDIKIFSNSVL